MPVAHLRLADLPAEEHVLAAPFGREVHETLAKVLHLHTELVERTHALRDRVGLARDVFSGVAHLTG